LGDSEIAAFHAFCDDRTIVYVIDMNPAVHVLPTVGGGDVVLCVYCVFSFLYCVKTTLDVVCVCDSILGRQAYYSISYSQLPNRFLIETTKVVTTWLRN